MADEGESFKVVHKTPAALKFIANKCGNFKATVSFGFLPNDLNDSSDKCR